MQLRRTCAAVLLVVLQFSSAYSLAGSDPAGRESDFSTPDNLIRSIYEMVTFGPGTTPDWDAAREAFLEEALVVLRVSREESAIFTVDGWIDDFVAFIEDRNVEETGFSETIIRMKTTEMGDIAHVLVLYESRLPGMPGRQGVDSFQLIRRNGRWWILSIANELPRWGFEIPDEIKPSSEMN